MTTAIDNAAVRGAQGQAEFDRLKSGYRSKRNDQLKALADFYRRKGMEQEAREYEEQVSGEMSP